VGRPEQVGYLGRKIFHFRKSNISTFCFTFPNLFKFSF
jgi:hypothetical protein